MKIIFIILVLNVFFLTSFLCENATTTIRPPFLRSKYARKATKINNTQVITNATGRPRTSLNLTSTTPSIKIQEPNANTTTAALPKARITVTTINPILNKTSASVSNNTTLNDTKQLSSVNPLNLSYVGCGIRNHENHPWIAVIEHTPPSYLDNSKLRVRKTLSKGVLIHPKYVLTTISSIHNSHPFWIVSAVRLGDKMTFDIADHNSTALQNSVKVSIAEVFVHRHKDIAIIKLAHKVNITDYIRPICLPSDSVYNYRELFSHLCKYRSYSRNRRERRVTTEPVSPISPQDCQIFFTRKQSGISAENEFCAWDEIGDTCAGDIGGPLFVEIDSKNTIIGLKSIATSDNEDLQLDTTIPGVYTRVGSYLKWISAIINSNE